MCRGPGLSWIVEPCLSCCTPTRATPYLRVTSEHLFDWFMLHCTQQDAYIVLHFTFRTAQHTNKQGQVIFRKAVGQRNLWKGSISNWIYFTSFHFYMTYMFYFFEMTLTWGRYSLSMGMERCVCETLSFVFSEEATFAKSDVINFITGTSSV